MSEPSYARRSARVLLLDAADRLLLFKLGDAWFAPGGGLDDGEQPREAAARELREETGLHVPVDDLGPLVATTSGHADLGWVSGLLRDDFFLHRVDSHRVDISGFEAHELSSFVEHRWWTPEELATTTTETIYPIRLAWLVAELVAGRIPSEPVPLPWHH
jgi:8-oxo-dGTP pyrophosphatase MutT (NUDIX family)